MERQMSEMTEARKAQMRALEQAATKGPWVAEPMWRRYGWKVWQHATMPPLDLAELHWESDAAFIAAARSFVPDALAHIERLEEAARDHDCPSFAMCTRHATTEGLEPDVCVYCEIDRLEGENERLTGEHATLVNALADRTEEVARLKSELRDVVIDRGVEWAKAGLAEEALATLRDKVKEWRDSMAWASGELDCHAAGAEGKSPFGHCCITCDDYVDRNGPLRAHLDATIVDMDALGLTEDQ
jgi:hypothetical protein